MLLSRPAFTLIAVLAVALGIGAGSAIFSVVNSVLLRPLPYPGSERLVTVWEINTRSGSALSTSSLPDFREWRARNSVFEKMAAYATGTFNITGDGEPERASGLFVSPEIFSLLGIRPALGRDFIADDEQYGRNRVVILSHGFWQRRFAADPGIVGKVITVNSEPYEVIAVMPESFQYPDAEAALYTPLSFPEGHYLNTRGNHYLEVVARLAPGVTIEQAQSEMTAICAQLEQELPENAGLSSRLVALREHYVGNVETALLMLLGAVGFLLLIACANVANLLLARATAREKEIAIRTALGAGRGRIIRQLLTESVLLAAIGGAAGLLLALWGVDVLVSLGPRDLPRLSEIGVDARALGFTFGLSLLTGVLFGLAPALHASKIDLNDSLKEGGRATAAGRAARTRGLLIVAEVALSLVLLAGAGLMIKSFLLLQDVDPGFSHRNVLTMSVSLPRLSYPDDQPRKRDLFFSQLIERIEALPGVEKASAVTAIPLGESSWGKMFSIEGSDLPTSLEDVPVIQYRQVAGDYFSTMGIELRSGRLFNGLDNATGPKVAIISEAMASRFFPGEDPLGKRVWLGPPESLLPADTGPINFPRYTIVGVVASVKHAGLDREPPLELYAPHSQADRGEVSRSMYIAARTGGDPRSLVSAIREQVRAIEKDQPVADIATMEERLSGSLGRQHFYMLLFGIFAVVALLLGTVGVYGVMNYSVTERRHEIGIRMALGASSGDVMKMVVRQGMKLAVAGIATGLAGALLLTRLMNSLLFETSPTDPLTLLAVAAAVAGVALGAVLVPARRATRIDPMVALRHE
jgi:putative ABC transport system permease protein